ncbi:hypothetical protein CALCODRAFT_339269 [Calocera cornea HHB12733]|uniref:Uncharacterized protein n=1 Tax=Calocera cornea HHB12733 TaxID=1353952 RepID=A0A165EYS3_9BASI|nr:hypothetical protein CALCODRAFT_339269 [Calocera cornea HHB12733]
MRRSGKRRWTLTKSLPRDSLRFDLTLETHVTAPWGSEAQRVVRRAMRLVHCGYQTTVCTLSWQSKQAVQRDLRSKAGDD